MGVLLWFLFGALTGWINEGIIQETNLRNSKQNVELGTNKSIFLGIIGALIAGWIVTLMGAPTIINVNPVSVGTPILGALSMLWLTRRIQERATVAHGH